MSTESFGGAPRQDHKPGTVEVSPAYDPEKEYDTKMKDLLRQRDGFLKGIADYQGNLNKVADLRAKLKNPSLFTDKSDLEKERMWRINKSEYEGSLQGVEQQMRALREKYGKPAEPGVQ